MKGIGLGAIAVAAFINVNLAPTSFGRQIDDIPAAKESLRTMVSPWFYRSLLVSPLEACIVVRGNLANDHLLNPKIIHSELNGRYDSLALELASNLQVLDLTKNDTSGSTRRVLVKLLVFQIADGKMAISFAHFDEPGGSQLRYSGSAWMGVQKADKWITIDPLKLAPHETRGPRTFTLAIEAPNSPRAIYGDKPNITAVSIQGGQAAATHVDRSR